MLMKHLFFDIIKVFLVMIYLIFKVILNINFNFPFEKIICYQIKIEKSFKELSYFAEDFKI
jgi:hypothetical protein